MVVQGLPLQSVFTSSAMRFAELSQFTAVSPENNIFALLTGSTPNFSTFGLLTR